MRAPAVVVLWLVTAQPAVAGLVVEPWLAGTERWDAALAASAGADRHAGTIGVGVAYDWSKLLQLGMRLDTAVRRTDFGLLEAPAVHLERRDLDLELRARAPWRWRGFGVQAGAGIGRRRIAYRPDRVTLLIEGMPIPVRLEAVHLTTYTLAAEVLHDLGCGELVLRSVWRRYGLDVWGRDGVARRQASDLQFGLGFRVRVH